MPDECTTFTRWRKAVNTVRSKHQWMSCSPCREGTPETKSRGITPHHAHTSKARLRDRSLQTYVLGIVAGLTKFIHHKLSLSHGRHMKRVAVLFTNCPIEYDEKSASSAETARESTVTQTASFQGSVRRLVRVGLWDCLHATVWELRS